MQSERDKRGSDLYHRERLARENLRRARGTDFEKEAETRLRDIERKIEIHDHGGRQ